MNKKLFIVGIIIASILAFIGIGFAAWGIVQQITGSAEGTFTGYTIIDLDDTSTEAVNPLFSYNEYGFKVDGEYRKTINFEVEFTITEKENPYNLTIELLDQDDFFYLSNASITAEYIYNNLTTDIIGKSIYIENINEDRSFKIIFTIDVENSYSSFYNYIYTQNKTMSILANGSTGDGSWAMIKKVELHTSLGDYYKVVKPAQDLTVFTYNGNDQTYNIPMNSGYIVNNNIQKNANTYDVVVTLKNGYIWSDNTNDILHYSFVIHKAKVFITSNTTINDAIIVNFTSPKTYSDFKLLINPQFNIANFDKFSIQCMFDGTFIYYDNLSDIASFTVYYKNEFKGVYDIVAGSTYKVYLKLSDTTNYEWDNSSAIRYVYLKYKTAKIGSVYYTIEEAISVNNTTAITLPANLTTEEANVQITAFSKLYSSTTYNNTNHELFVPYSNYGTTDTYYTYSGTIYPKQIKSTDASTYQTGACLYIPNGITYNSSKTIYVTSCEAGQGCVGDHGVLFNDGTINLSNNAILYSYGYIKGNGLIDLDSTTQAYDVMRILDYPGSATATSNVYNGGAGSFPFFAWIVNNNSCNTVYHNGAMLYAVTNIYGTSAGYKEAKVLLIGQYGQMNGLFLPKNNSSSNKVIKYGIDGDCNTMFTSNNQGKTLSSENMSNVFTNIDIYGKYQDATVSATIYISISTTKDLPLCISHANITIKSGSDLSITKTSFIFACGTRLTIEENSKLDIGSGVNIVFDELKGKSMAVVNYLKAAKYNVSARQISAVCVNNGTITGSGNIGGFISTNVVNAMFTVTGKSVSGMKIKTAANASGSLSTPLDATGFINSSLETGNLSAAGYISLGETNSYWAELTDVNEFYINYRESNDSDISTSTFYSLSDTYLPNVNELDSPLKNGYAFIGWYSNVNLDDAYLFENLADVDKTISVGDTLVLYAKWEKISYLIEYHIFDIDMETIYDGDVTNTNPISFQIDSSFTLNDATTPNLFFSGWFVDTEYNYGAIYNFGTNSFETLYISLIDENNVLHLYGYFSETEVLQTYTVTYLKLKDSFEGDPTASTISDYEINVDLMETVIEGDSMTLQNG